MHQIEQQPASWSYSLLHAPGVTSRLHKPVISNIPCEVPALSLEQV